MEEVKKGAWSPEEDTRLISYITKYGVWNWSQMPKFAGLARTGKSCRLRWINYLSPDVKRGPFTLQEVEVVVRVYLTLGNRWSAIAAQLPGRTDNDIKNFYHTHLKKRLQSQLPIPGRTHKNQNNNAVMLQLDDVNGSPCNNNKFEEKLPPPPASVNVAGKPRHCITNTYAVVLDRNNPDHSFEKSSSSAGMDKMYGYDEIKSFWYNLLIHAEYIKF